MTDFVLRPWREGDAAAFYRHSNSETIHYNMRDSFPKTLEECEETVKSFLESGGETTCFRAVEIDGEAAGSIGMHIHKDDLTGAEISYWLGENYWRGGIMSRAIQAFIQNIFDGCGSVDHVVAYPYSFNEASKKMLEKLGFVHEKTIHKEDCNFPVKSDYEKYVLKKKGEF